MTVSMQISVPYENCSFSLQGAYYTEAAQMEPWLQPTWSSFALVYGNAR